MHTEMFAEEGICDYCTKRTKVLYFSGCRGVFNLCDDCLILAIKAMAQNQEKNDGLQEGYSGF